jgi:hypothetical protein
MMLVFLSNHVPNKNAPTGEIGHTSAAYASVKAGPHFMDTVPLLGTDQALGQERPDRSDDGEDEGDGHGGCRGQLFHGSYLFLEELQVKCKGKAAPN